MYCASTVERRGVRECPEPISAEAASHRRETTVLHLRGGRLESVDFVNGLGALREDGSGVAAEQYRYEGGRLRAIVVLSSARVPRYTKAFSDDLTRIDFVARSGRPRLMWKLVTAEVRTFDERGFVASRRFFDRLENPTLNALDVYQVDLAREEHGYLVEVRYLDDKQRPMISNEGFHRMTYELAARGSTKIERHFGLQGEAATTSFGNSYFESEQDAWGNDVSARFFDANGKPATDSRSSARWVDTFDGHGNVIEVTRFGTNGEPAAGPGGWALQRLRVDSRGRTVERQYWDPEGRPTLLNPVRKYKYDERDRVVEWRYFDGSGEPKKVGVQAERATYDDHDNKVRVRLFDADGHPTAGVNRYAEYRVTFNEDDQPIEKRYFGADGGPVDSYDESARAVYTYDAAGKLIKTDLFDPLGNTTLRMGARTLVVMYKGASKAGADIKRTKEDARLRAEEAKKKIAEGMSFEEAVRLYGDAPPTALGGGDLGIFAPGRMVPELEAGLLATPVGEVSAVFETPFGFHVLRRTR